MMACRRERVEGTDDRLAAILKPRQPVPRSGKGD
jgi:hypothetical protein